MNTKARIVTASSLAFLSLVILGFWVGAFETFGGFLSRKRAFLIGSIAIGLIAALFLNRRCGVNYALAGGFLVISHFLYVFGQAIGQAYYVGATNPREYVHLIRMALNNQL